MAQQLDDNQRTALAVLLCIMVFIFYSQYVVPPPVPAPQAVPAQTATGAAAMQAPAQISSAAVAATGGSAAVATTTSALPTQDQLSQSTSTVIESDVYRAEINHLGARLSSFTLSKYRAQLDSTEPLEMVKAGSGEPLPLGLHIGSLSDALVPFTLVSSSGAQLAPDGKTLLFDASSGAGEEPAIQLTFEGEISAGHTLRKVLRFTRSTFVFDVQASISPALTGVEPLWLEWNTHLSEEQVKSSYNLAQVSTLDSKSSVQHFPASAIAQVYSDPLSAAWVTLGDVYFIGALLPPLSATESLALRPTRHARIGNSFSVRMAGTDALTDSTAQNSFRVYIGPKAYTELQIANSQLERSVDLGWFSFLAYPLLALLSILHKVLQNWGLAIIALTLVIKTAFLPLTKASFTSMQAMQQLQPEVKALRERIKDPTQLNQEMLALYKKRGVNPMGGCLPALIQLPVFLGLYNALLNSIELRHAPFALWVHDLSSPEYLSVLGLPIPVMVLIMGASMFAQQWTMPSSMDEQQKKIMMMMPFIFTIMFIVFPMPAGLVLYWLVNNTISIIQQMYMRSDKKAGPFAATAVASGLIFSLGFILTLL